MPSSFTSSFWRINVLTSVLSRVALAAVPGAGLVVSVLVPVVAYVVTQRKIDLRLTID